jgi:hypothetical protein
MINRIPVSGSDSNGTIGIVLKDMESLRAVFFLVFPPRKQLRERDRVTSKECGVPCQ